MNRSQPHRRDEIRRTSGACALLMVVGLALGCSVGEVEKEGVIAKITWDFQTEAGGERHRAEVDVLEVPENPWVVPAEEVNLPEKDLVLGVVIGGQARAYPIRYLALSEIVDDWVGDTPIAPSW